MKTMSLQLRHQEQQGGVKVALIDIKKHRQRKEMSVQELADACGVTRQMIFQIESGKRRPSIETLLKIANVLNVGVGELLKDETLKK